MREAIAKTLDIGVDRERQRRRNDGLAPSAPRKPSRPCHREPD